MSQRIVIVEDDEGLRDILELVLEQEGFVVDTCEDGQQALDYFGLAKKENRELAMVILDLNMPVIDGWQVAKWLDADPELGKIPVVVISATEEHGEAAKKLHADAYLVKPFSTDEILGVVGLFSLLGP